MQLSSQTLSLSEKLNLLADAAKYDVACTSSGVNRAGKQGHLAIRSPAVSVTAFLPTDAVSLC